MPKPTQTDQPDEPPEDWAEAPFVAPEGGIRVINSDLTVNRSPVRFPSHRGALWDRTARGNAVVITPATPHISFLPSLLPQIAQYAASNAGEGTMVAHLEGTIAAPKEGSGVLPFIDVSLHGLGGGSATTVGRQPPTGATEA